MNVACPVSDALFTTLVDFGKHGMVCRAKIVNVLQPGANSQGHMQDFAKLFPKNHNYINGQLSTCSYLDLFSKSQFKQFLRYYINTKLDKLRKIHYLIFSISVAGVLAVYNVNSQDPAQDDQMYAL
jgi:hypothetical protein